MFYQQLATVNLRENENMLFNYVSTPASPHPEGVYMK